MASTTKCGGQLAEDLTPPLKIVWKNRKALGSEAREIWVQILTLTRLMCVHRLTAVHLAGLLWALNMIVDIKQRAHPEDKRMGSYGW